MYLLPIGGKFLHGIFNCPLSEVDLWKPVVLQVIHSIEDFFSSSNSILQKVFPTFLYNSVSSSSFVT